MEYLANTYFILFNMEKFWLGIEYLLIFLGKLVFGFQDLFFGMCNLPIKKEKKI